MKNRIHILILIFLIPTLGVAQDEFTAKFPISGGTEGFAISKSEKIWIATKPGKTYFTEKLGDLWHLGTLTRPDGISGGIFDRVNYVSDSILIISGFIHGKNSETNFIYRSKNNGKTWEKFIFGKSSWIDAFYSNGQGKIWMSGSSQLIYYSDDYGKTWKEFDKVEKKGNLRFSTIHFSKNDSIGLFSSFWNVIYKTTDNCQSWVKIPTPLSQNKYSRLSKEDRPDIRKIRVFNNYLIVNQQGNIFYSNQDSINWIQIPNVVNFEVTKNRELIYFINKDLTIQTFDKFFKPKWQSIKKLNKFSLIETQNENLYVFTYSDIYRINQNDFSKYELLTNEVPISEPYQKLTYNGELIGFKDSRILKYDKDKQAWYKYMSVPFNIANSVKFKNGLIISDPGLQYRYSVELDKKEINKFVLPNELFDLENNKIVSIRFEVGSQGCFHSNLIFKEYKLKGDNLNLKDKSDKEFNKIPKIIEINSINNLVKLIDSTRYAINSKKDLKITEEDILEYIELIKKEAKKIEKSGYDKFSNYDNLYSFYGENTDFNFYINTIENFDSIPDSIINKVFDIGYGNWSTTRDWTTLTIKFEDKSILAISNSDDKPNYLNLPWIIKYNGFIFKSNSIILGEYISKISNEEMINKEALKKKYALFKIADFMYRQKINN